MCHGDASTILRHISWIRIMVELARQGRRAPKVEEKCINVMSYDVFLQIIEILFCVPCWLCTVQEIGRLS